MENNHLIINDWIKTYLIGPMEEVAEGDGGRNWRRDFSIELAKRVDINENPIFIFDPTLEEQNKIGMESETFHKKVKGWLSCGKNDEVKKYADLIWKGKTYLEMDGKGKARLVKILGDIDYVVNSHFLVARMNKGDSPCGTFGEAGIAVEHNIPIYVIQTMPRIDYKGSFVHFVFASGGQFFNSQNELLTFLDEKYKLKVKKEK